MALRRGADRRVEHRREEARDEGEDRRIRPAGLFAHQKSLVPDKGGKGIDVGNREFILLVWRYGVQILENSKFSRFYGESGAARPAGTALARP